MKKILVALSGGVDSSVAAFLLKEKGYVVSTAYMKTWVHEEGSDFFGDCLWQQDIQDARSVAKCLRVDFDVLNLMNDYRKHVVNYLIEGYKNGVTPNPDIMCNREIKFGVFLQYALAQGFDGIATGHYCRRIQNPDGSFDVLEGLDKNKDQSYFLALITQNQLKQALFPIGDLKKTTVRAIAKQHKFPNADKKESQGICFLGKVCINDFLKQFIPDAPGNIINLEGEILGAHKGLHCFTLGQRKGMAVPSNKDFEKYVVVAKNYEKNELVVAFESTNPPGLHTRDVALTKLSFINKPLSQEAFLLGKPRYRDPSQAIKWTPQKASTATVRFSNPQRALAKGQLLALYQEDKLLGGGFYS